MNKCKELKFEESCFYKIGSKRKLAEVLKIEYRELLILKNRPLYNTFINQTNKDKPREIQAPTGELKLVHKRIGFILSQLKTPSYLFSGKKGWSAHGNSLHHQNWKFGLKADIRKFFPSCSRKNVSLFFRYDLKMAPDVASFLSKICTYRNFIPTGSPLSMSLAFWANHFIFDEIDTIAKREGLTFSLYVDDMNFSGLYIRKNLIADISRQLKRVSLKIHPHKTRRFNPGEVRIITGTALKNGKCLVPNNLRFKIIKHSCILNSSNEISLKMKQKMIGLIQAARTIEPLVFSSLLSQFPLESEKLAITR